MQKGSNTAAFEFTEASVRAGKFESASEQFDFERNTDPGKLFFRHTDTQRAAFLRSLHFAVIAESYVLNSAGLLRTPVRLDAELGVTEPVGNVIVG